MMTLNPIQQSSSIITFLGGVISLINHVLIYIIMFMIARYNDDIWSHHHIFTNFQGSPDFTVNAKIRIRANSNSISSAEISTFLYINILAMGVKSLPAHQLLSFRTKLRIGKLLSVAGKCLRIP